MLPKLIKRKDVDVIVNACDAGREGELIFRYIYETSAARKPVRRALALVDDRQARSARPSPACATAREMQPLEDGRAVRGEADWLVGMNATRAATTGRLAGRRRSRWAGCRRRRWR